MREIFNLNEKWAFSKEAMKPPVAMPQNWYWVNLPHTWNAIPPFRWWILNLAGEYDGRTYRW